MSTKFYQSCKDSKIRVLDIGVLEQDLKCPCKVCHTVGIRHKAVIYRKFSIKTDMEVISV